MYKTPERSTPRRQPCSGALTSCPHVLTCCFVCTRTGGCISVLPARVQVHSAAQCCTIHAFPHMPTPLTNMPLFVFTRFFSLSTTLTWRCVRAIGQRQQQQQPGQVMVQPDLPPQLTHTHTVFHVCGTIMPSGGRTALSTTYTHTRTRART